MAVINWIGIHRDDHRRVWGYATTAKSYNQSDLVRVFWGTRNNIFFKICRNDSAFRKIARRKEKNYRQVDDRVVVDIVHQELEQVLILEKLTGQV